MNRRLIALMSGLHLALYRRTGGRIGANLGGPMLLLTTTGRKSGQPRTKPLLYLQDGDRYIVVGSYGGAPHHPAWWLNLLADPAATIQVGSTELRVRAREAAGDERARLWQGLLEIYAPYDAYKARTTRTIPVVILEPA